MDWRARRGFSLIEVTVVLGLVVLVAGITLMSLKPGKDKTSSLALATALADEFRSARQLAISNGHPVAVCFPTNGGSQEVANSIYRLEGWNVPRVTWSKGFGGDYPDLGFGAARWSGPNFTDGAPLPPLTKAAAFNITTWVPSAHRNDTVYCFTPDGGVITDNLPALDGNYTVVVAKNPAIAGRTVSAGADATVVQISANGAVNYSKSVAPNLTASNSTARSNPKTREQLSGSARIRLSAINIRPSANDVSADAFCTPGQQVTFELFAYDPEGRELFTQWTQTGTDNRLGTFTFPEGTVGLTSETERMEYIPNPQDYNIDWGTAAAPTDGCFRSRWTWTVPLTSRVNDIYQVEADVQDATGNATIENPPPPIRLPAPPAGRLLVEMFNPALNRVEMVRMNPDGSGKQILTPMGLEEQMPSVDGTGTKVAFLQGPIGNINNRTVKIRSLTGGGEFTVAGPGRFTSVSLSPDGSWISYRLDNAGSPGQGTLFIRSVDPSGPVHSQTQTWGGSVADVEKCRTGWSNDGNFAYWGDDNKIMRTALGGSFSTSTVLTYGLNALNATEQLFAPASFTPPDGEERILFTIGNYNPVLGHVKVSSLPLTNVTFSSGIALVDLNGGGGGAGSSSFNDNLPAVSADSRKLVLPRTDLATGNARGALIADWQPGAGTFVSTPPGQTIEGDIRSVVWLP